MGSLDYLHGSRTWFRNTDEDTLTAWVFSAMDELSPESFLQKFLAAIERANGLESGILSSRQSGCYFHPWPGLDIPENYRKVFKQMDKEHKGGYLTKEARLGEGEVKYSIEPDMLIASNDWTLWIESEKSKALEPVQLVQQFVMARQDERTHPSHWWVLLLNGTLWKPGDMPLRLAALCSRYGKSLRIKTKDLSDRILWFNWQGVYELLKAVYESETGGVERKVIWDRLHLLNLAGLAPPHLLDPRFYIECDRSDELGVFLAQLKSVRSLGFERIQIDSEEAEQLLTWAKRLRAQEEDGI